MIGLSHNSITSRGACSLADALARNSSMERLFLNYNPGIGNFGGCALAEATRNHPTLLRLGVAFCSLSRCSGEELLKTLDCTPHMERICVSGNNFDYVTEVRMKMMPKFNFAEIK